MLSRLKAHLHRSFFRPGLTGLIINPFHIARTGLYRGVASLAARCNGRLLDVGCGRKPYEHLFAVEQYVGIEVGRRITDPSCKADCLYAGERLPFADQSFDCVVAFQVFEHVFTPGLFLREVERVLKPGGQLMLTVPFAWDEHEQPYDFARYSSFGLKALLEEAGFQVVEARKVNADLRVLFQLLNAYIFKTIFTRSPMVNLVLATLITFPISVVGIVLGWLLPANPDLYLDNLILASKGEVRE